jgi:hypothetical protein
MNDQAPLSKLDLVHLQSGLHQKGNPAFQKQVPKLKKKMRKKETLF